MWDCSLGERGASQKNDLETDSSEIDDIAGIMRLCNAYCLITY